MARALAFAEHVHAGQKRESGEPYIIHPVAVAGYLLDMGMDEATIIAGLLHDTVEDGDNVSLTDIEKQFGREVAKLVDGVTKLTRSGKQEYVTKKQEQSENLRKLFLAIADDVRVVIIKLNDRLHNMRTLEYCTPQKRARKAKETLEVYTPLAHRFGMGAIRSELEDLSFKYLMPEEYERIREPAKFKQVSRMVAETRREREEYLEKVISILHGEMDKIGVGSQIMGRPKHLYSIYQKMSKKGKGFSEIYDLIAIRVIVNTVNDCYAALGVVHAEWKPLPGRFKDYIAMPKPNMYRSLHTTLMNKNGIPFEVQIRTHEMHETAEYGVAAHWMYKEGRTVQTELDKKTYWLRQVVEARDTTEDSREFVDNIVKDFLGEYVYVLTPKGEIIDLPIGSTPLDFAYRIHTNIGHHCQHAKVNGAVVRLDYTLKTNDVVEIITSNTQPGPSRDWLNIVKTQSAKNKIRQWYNLKVNPAAQVGNMGKAKGREMLEESARRHGQDLSRIMKQEYISSILKKHNLQNAEDMYAAIGYGGISSGQVLHKLIELNRKAEKVQSIQQSLEAAAETPAGSAGILPAKKNASHGNSVIVSGDPNMAVRFGNCCNPLPGDPIVGYVTRGRGVSIHRADCKNLQSLRLDKERFLPVEWNMDDSERFSATVQLHLVDKTGSLLEISKLLTASNIYISDMSAQTSPDGVAVMRLTFMVSDTAQLNSIISSLKRLKSVIDVRRVSK